VVVPPGARCVVRRWAAALQVAAARLIGSTRWPNGRQAAGDAWGSPVRADAGSEKRQRFGCLVAISGEQVSFREP